MNTHYADTVQIFEQTLCHEHMQQDLEKCFCEYNLWHYQQLINPFERKMAKLPLISDHMYQKTAMPDVPENLEDDYKKVVGLEGRVKK